MAVEKTVLEKKSGKQSILGCVDYLFYVSKVFGMITYSLSDYRTKQQFKLSQFGNVWSLLSCINYITQYHILNRDLLSDSGTTVGE